jgi:hypothetical protein
MPLKPLMTASSGHGEGAVVAQTEQFPIGRSYNATNIGYATTVLPPLLFRGGS